MKDDIYNDCGDYRNLYKVSLKDFGLQKRKVAENLINKKSI